MGIIWWWPAKGLQMLLRKSRQVSLFYILKLKITEKYTQWP